MTAKQVYLAVLTEMNKVNAPSFVLDDFNYLANKAINQYINKKYNTYDINQQSKDDLGFLETTAMLTPKKASQYIDYANGDSGIVNDDVALMDSLYGATYEVMLPDDYLHLLNCVCIYKVKENNGCHNANTYWHVGATRLTADLWSQILNNEYMKPKPRRPYYYIHNVNTQNDVPTNPVIYSNGQLISGTDATYNNKTISTIFYANSITLKNDGEQQTIPVNIVSRYDDEVRTFIPYKIISIMKQGNNDTWSNETGLGISVTQEENDYPYTSPYFNVTIPSNQNSGAVYRIGLQQQNSKDQTYLYITVESKSDVIYYGVTFDKPTVGDYVSRQKPYSSSISLNRTEGPCWAWVLLPNTVQLGTVTDKMLGGISQMDEDTQTFAAQGLKLYYIRTQNRTQFPGVDITLYKNS